MATADPVSLPCEFEWLTKASEIGGYHFETPVKHRALTTATERRRCTQQLYKAESGFRKLEHSRHKFIDVHGALKVDTKLERNISPLADQEDLTPLDYLFRQRSASKGSSRSCSRSCSGTPRKRSNAPPGDDRLVRRHHFRSNSGSKARSAKEAAKCVLIFDWDDTLFPTTWLRDDCGFDWRKPLDAQLRKTSQRGKRINAMLNRFAERASALLREASKLQRVVIVTLARRGWVHKSIERFCPRLAEVIEECKPKIVYAQEYVAVPRDTRLLRTAEEVLEYWTEVKASAIRKELAEEGVAWTDILSFGDSQYERAGTKRVASELSKLPELNGGGAAGVIASPLYSKTIKTLNCPTVEECTAQMTVLLRWLPFIADRDSDIDLEIDEADDEALNKMDQLIRGKVCCGLSLRPRDRICPRCSMRRPDGPEATEEVLSWVKLAEMEEYEAQQCLKDDSARQDDIGDQLFEMVSSMSCPLAVASVDNTVAGTCSH